MEIFATYGRVSSLKQKDNFSIQTQIQMMRDGCVAQGWEVYAELAEVGSAWADGLERSELQKALELARDKKITALMYFSPDRFTRDMGDGVELRKKLRQYGVKLYCFYPVLQEITGGTMEIVNVLTDWQAQQENEKRRDSSQRSIGGKIDMGLYPQGWILYGYRVEGKKKNTTIVIEEYERAIILQIYQWYYYEGKGPTEIAEILNAQGVVSDRMRDPTGSTWSSRRILDILKNEAYTGLGYVNRYKRISKNKQIERPKNEWKPIVFPVIIPKKYWQEVQERIAMRHTGRSPRNEYLMSCRITCTCGKHMSSKPKRIRDSVYLYYSCNGEHLKEKRTCFQKAAKAPDVDRIVWQFAYELLMNPEKVLAGYRAMKDELDAEQITLATRIASLEEEIANYTEQLTTVVEEIARTKSDTTKRIFQEKADQLGGIIDKLTRKKEGLEEKRIVEDLNESEILEEIEVLRRTFVALHNIDDEADFQAKRALIELLNLKATIRTEQSGERWVDIHWMRSINPRLLCPQSSRPARR
jgi:site-specific DNA recombinase